MNISKMFRESLSVARGNLLMFVPMLVASIFSALVGLLFIGSAVPVWRGMPADHFTGHPGQGLTGPGTVTGGMLLFIVLCGLAALLSHSMTAGMADMAFQGEKASLKDGWTRVVSRIVPVVIASVLMDLIIGLGMIFLVLPGIILAFFLMFTLIAVMVSNLGAFQAVGRSFRTVGKNFAATFITLLIIIGLAILTGLLASILYLIPFAGKILSPVIFAVFTGFVTVFLVRVYNEIELPDSASPELET